MQFPTADRSDGARADESPHPTLAWTQADLAAFAGGDSRAFERIWQRLHPACEVLLAGRFRAGLEPPLRVRLDSELDDILQETAITVLRQMGGFDYRGPGSLLAWAGTIAVRTAGDRVGYWRAGKRAPGSQRRLGTAGRESTSALRASAVADPASGPNTRLHRAEKRRQLADALATLPERFQTIALWRFFAGATWAEIAAEVGSPSADAVKMECLLKVLPAIAAAMAQQAKHETRPDSVG